MSFKLTDKDNGFRALMARMKEAAKGGGVSVGVHADEGAEVHSVANAITTDAHGRTHVGGKYVSKKKAAELRGRAQQTNVTVLDVAIWNEFGIGVPERSFLRAWYDASGDANREKLRKAMTLVVKGERTLEQALELVGLKFQGELQKEIARGVGQPNAPSTVKKKGSSTPLIDTGQLRQSITFKVREKDH